MGGWENEGFFNTGEYSENTRPSLVPNSMVISPAYKELSLTQEANFPHLFNIRPRIFNNIWDIYSELMFRIYKKIVETFKPKFVQYLMGSAEVAHYDTYARYVLGIKRADEMIFYIWQMIQHDSFYKNNTYLIISPDNGRDMYYMPHYENTYDDPSRVWLYIYGPTIKKGKTINRPVCHMDIFATIAYILHLKTHATDGKVLNDCLG